MKRVILFVSAILLIHASFSIAGSESYVSATYVNKADKEALTLTRMVPFISKYADNPPISTILS